MIAVLTGALASWALQKKKKKKKKKKVTHNLTLITSV
jgi:hypothetical protein